MLDIFTRLADWTAWSLLRLDPGSKLGDAAHFFVEDTAKIFALLAVMIYAIAFLRAGIDAARVRSFLSGKSRLPCYFLAAVLGAVTPFCSCSSIPLFLGFTAARIPVSIAMAFLVTSPCINEAAVAMLGGTVGWGLSAVYVGMGLAAGVFAGVFFDAIKAERFLAVAPANAPCGCQCGGKASGGETAAPGFRGRRDFAKAETHDILKRIWLWVVAGIALGAGLHGFVPDGFIASRLGGGQWWSVPLTVAIGIPTYANVTSVIPVAGELIAKGLPVGTAFAFMLSTAAASIPEFIMLRKVMAGRMLAIFAGYLLVYFTLCGWMLNAISC